MEKVDYKYHKDGKKFPSILIQGEIINGEKDSSILYITDAK